MESGQGVGLSFDAYAQNLLDFSEYNPLDRNWWRKFNWMFTYLERSKLMEVFHLRHKLNCAAISYQNTQKQFDLHWNQARVLEQKITKRLFPWLEIVEETREQQISKLADQWKQLYGDPDDEETQRRINETVLALRKRTIK